MTRDTPVKMIESRPSEVSNVAPSDVKLSRRCFVQLVGAGLLITVAEGPSLGQRRGGGGSALPVVARVRLNPDGTFNVMTGKVEEGQGPRAQLTQAAAEELQVPPHRIRLIMADTALVPDDGITAGSRTTPYTVPAVRQGAATARELLIGLAAKRWKVERSTLKVIDGVITGSANGPAISYADLAKADNADELFTQGVSSDVALTVVEEWDVLGTSVARPNLRDLVTGAHRYPSDIVRPNMLYGKTLRPPSYGATLEAIDLSSIADMKDVVVVRDNQFVGCAAPTSFRAAEAVETLAKTASWKTVSHPSGKDLFEHLKKNARTGDRARPRTGGSVDEGFSAAAKVLGATYEAAYIQHTPMEPRAAVAEWNNGKLTVWTGVDGPQRVQRDLARTFGIDIDRVRVIVPDMGGGFGGKHTGEAAEEAARMAKAAGRPVWVRWTRADEFTWAYFRPAAVIECKGALDRDGKLTTWDFTTINPGGAALDTPYDVPNVRVLSARTDSPLRQGAYRCLGATVNNFARESFIDELAAAAGIDPLAFRLAHLQNSRIRAVLEAAARSFNWSARRKKITPELGVGVACGTEKNSVVAACVEVAVDREKGEIKVNEVCEAFECGPVQNPANLTAQVQGCIIMGFGGALKEAIEFEDGKILNASFAGYRVPRFRDVPRIDVHLVENRDIPSAGAGETPIIAVAPAIGNAVFAATGIRLRSMPMRGSQLKQV